MAKRLGSGWIHNLSAQERLRHQESAARASRRQAEYRRSEAEKAKVEAALALPTRNFLEDEK